MSTPGTCLWAPAHHCLCIFACQTGIGSELVLNVSAHERPAQHGYRTGCMQVLVVACSLTDTEDLVWWQPYQASPRQRRTSAWLPGAIEVASHWQESQVGSAARWMSSASGKKGVSLCLAHTWLRAFKLPSTCMPRLVCPPNFRLSCPFALTTLPWRIQQVKGQPGADGNCQMHGTPRQACMCGVQVYVREADNAADLASVPPTVDGSGCPGPWDGQPGSSSSTRAAYELTGMLAHVMDEDEAPQVPPLPSVFMPHVQDCTGRLKPVVATNEDDEPLQEKSSGGGAKKDRGGKQEEQEGHIVAHIRVRCAWLDRACFAYPWLGLGSPEVDQAPFPVGHACCQDDEALCLPACKPRGTWASVSAASGGQRQVVVNISVQSA